MMKKILALLMVLGMLAGCMTVYAGNYRQEETIFAGETKVVTVPRPEGEIDPGWVYFSQTFHFVPEEDGTYLFLVSYEDDESDPYDIFMDVAGPYWELENGCKFVGKAGESCELLFQYLVHDGRYPEFTFYVDSEEAILVPKTGDAGILLYVCTGLLSAAAAGLMIAKRKEYL